MTMRLYTLFSQNVKIKYKGTFFSKAMIFASITTALSVVIPFMIAKESRGKYPQYFATGYFLLLHKKEIIFFIWYLKNKN